MAKPRLPEIDLTDDRLLAMADLLEQMAIKRCPDPDDFEAFSRASMAVVADVQWGAHHIEEPLYRRIGVHNGPTLKPLDVRIGVIEGVVLPSLARAAGALMTSRQTEQLLLDDQGCAHIIGHLRRELAGHREQDERSPADSDDDLVAHLQAALTYFDKRRSHMSYAQARAANLPVASGATESTCSLFQLRVKHPGSHWSPTGLRGVMAARGLDLSNRWDHAFDAHHATLHEEILAA